MMSTRSTSIQPDVAAFLSGGPRLDRRRLPKHLRRPYLLREHVFASLDATNNTDFETLYKILSEYLQIP
jgi:hypothetical protein